MSSDEPTANISLGDAEAFEKLKADLHDLYAAFRIESVDAPPEHRRVRSYNMLMIFGEFLRRIGAEHPSDDAYRLAMALHDLGVSTIHAMLEPLPIANRPVSSTEIEEKRAYVALAMASLAEGGKKKKRAAEFLAANFKAINRFCETPPKDLIETILSWEKRFSRKLSNNTLVQSSVYDRHLPKVIEAIQQAEAHDRESIAINMATALMIQALDLSPHVNSRSHP